MRRGLTPTDTAAVSFVARGARHEAEAAVLEQARHDHEDAGKAQRHQHIGDAWDAIEGLVAAREIARGGENGVDDDQEAERRDRGRAPPSRAIGIRTQAEEKPAARTAIIARGKASSCPASQAGRLGSAVRLNGRRHGEPAET